MKHMILTLMVFWLLVAQAWAQPMQQTATIRCADGSYPTTVAITEVFAGAGHGEVLALVTGSRIRIWGWRLQSTVDTTMRFTRGTGTDCATGTADVTGDTSPFTSVNRPFDNPTLSAPIVMGTVSNALCIRAGAAATISGWLLVCQEP